MAEYAVWAPLAQKVRLHLDHAHRPLVMQREGDWWKAEAVAELGTRYEFALDDGPLMPDPRSCSQPDGPHGASEVVDLGAFVWTDGKWKGIDLKRVVIYELHVGTFTLDGTFDSAIERLDHLVDLGVGAVELMPVAGFPGERGWGYDGVSLYAPHEAYGGPAGLQRLVDACHARGLGVVLDVVYNHLGPDGNYLPAFGPYFTDRHHTPWGSAVNFDAPLSRGVRDFVIGNVEMWLECYHVDALRLDAVHAIVDESPKHIVAEICEVAHRVGHQRGYPAYVTGESDLNDPTIVRSPKNHGWGADAQWSDDFHHSLHAILTGERESYYEDYGSLEQLAKCIRDGYTYTGQYSKFRGAERGAPTVGVSRRHFVAFSQNHDQIGNRPNGERLSMLIDPRLLDVAAALTILGPFVPLLFQGEEWGAQTPFLYFTDHQNAELGHAVTEGRRQEFAYAHDVEPADPQDVRTFQSSKLDWTELQKPESTRLLEWYKTLIRLRTERPDFVSEDCEVVVDGDVLTMQRGESLVVCNFGSTAREIHGVHVEPYAVHIKCAEAN